MRSNRKAVPEPEFTDAELDVFGEFSEAERDGKNPDIEEYLGRIPESADKLRSILETVVKLCAEIRKLKAVYSDEELARLLDPGRRAKRK
jgi:hypothetical protein